MNEGGTWMRTKWLSQQKEGLYVLYGYLADEKQDAHFVACDVTNGYIYDSFTCLKYNFCFESVMEIFPFGIDCALKLIIESN
jgi:hypothetical protein